MFIQNQNLVSNNDIISVKLLSGEEIVGRLVDQSGDTLTIAKPVAVTLQPMGKQMGLTFIPVLGSVDPDTSLVIPKSAIAVRAVKTNKAVTNSYIEMTSGLVVANGANFTP